MSGFSKLLLGDYNGNRFVGFDSRSVTDNDSIIAVLGNLGFLYNLRTGVLHVRIMSSLKERSHASQAE